MKKQHALIWAAWLTQGVAWFVPVIGEGTSLPNGVPGWQAFRVAFCAVWPYGDAQFEHWYNAVLATMSAVTAPLFIIGSVWAVWFGSRTVRRVSAWISAGAFVINAQWLVLVVGFGPNPNDLKIGYFLWWFSFLLLAWGLFVLSGSRLPDGSQ
ncbi:MAG TPA: hypothetical protein VMU53_15290 [Candidatus Sulfotelmatobacter sp.]|nr:hypothetical protein [Candidatus Sulfotelmatobacter sp.]